MLPTSKRARDFLSVLSKKYFKTIRKKCFVQKIRVRRNFQVENDGGSPCIISHFAKPDQASYVHISLVFP